MSSELSFFLKGNKKEKKNGFFPATKSLCDEKGEPLMWEIRPITTKENEILRDECMEQRIIAGMGATVEVNYRKYIARMMCECIVFPDLNSKELQDSYGVKKPEDLLQEMIDDPGEYNEFAAFIQEYNGFDEPVDLKDEAKN